MLYKHRDLDVKQKQKRTKVLAFCFSFLIKELMFSDS